MVYYKFSRPYPIGATQEEESYPLKIVAIVLR